MTATLTFNLDNTDDKKAHYRCIKSLDLTLALWEINQLTFNEYVKSENLIDEITKVFEKYNIILENLLE